MELKQRFQEINAYKQSTQAQVGLLDREEVLSQLLLPNTMKLLHFYHLVTLEAQLSRD